MENTGHLETSPSASTETNPSPLLTHFRKMEQAFYKEAPPLLQERIQILKKIRAFILKNQNKIIDAIHQDLHRHPTEAKVTEIIPVISEINHYVKNLKKWLAPQKVKTPHVLLGTKSYTKLTPKGVVLVISPWNYPFLLAISPMIAALMAGNRVVIKPSEYSSHTSSFLNEMIEKLFPTEQVKVFEGDHHVGKELLNIPFHHIFFTGSTGIGKIIMESAAKNLTSVTLELGGKSPVVIDPSASISKAARKVSWGKFVNAGQTCLSPDYVLIPEDKKDEFIQEVNKYIHQTFGKTKEDIKKSPHLARIINERHTERLSKLINQTVNKGGKLHTELESDSSSCYLSPTILSNVDFNSPIMSEELFGPVLPVLTYKSQDDILKTLQYRARPLGIYIFSEDKESTQKIIDHTQSGAVVVNDVMIHFANHDLPFGGTGESGMGSYHGLYGLKAFSDERPILERSGGGVLENFYPPYTEKTKKLINFVVEKLDRFL